MKQQAKSEAKPNMVAITTGAAAATKANPHGFAFREGDVLARDHPAVKAAPMFFLPFGATTEQIHEAKAAIGVFGSLG